MGRTVRKKQFTNTSVYDAAIARVEMLYDRYDEVVVSFSGGKDSTVCLNLCLEVAKRKKRLPVRAHFWDEEAIYTDTVDYVRRVAQRDDVDLKWFCLPIRHRNACSRREPYWYPWDPDKKDLWVLPLPKEAITKLKGFEKGMTMPEAAHLAFGPEYGSVADVRGLRADESLNRYRAVMGRLKDNWIGEPRGGNNSGVSPIYDWTTTDVWFYPKMNGIDYNRAYDIMDMAGIPPHWQRCCPPFGEEPIRSLWVYSVGWPELWDRMTRRVHGAVTASRYSTTELYGFGDLECPKGLTWKDWCFKQLDLYPEPYRGIIAGNIEDLMRAQRRKTRRPIHETKADPATGISWRYLAMLVNRGDLKNRRKSGATAHANYERDKAGLSLEETMDADGTRY